MILLLADVSDWPLGAFLFGALAFFVSLGTLSVAWMNYKTASDKLRLDLFDRRFQVFLATRELFDWFRADPDNFIEPLNNFLFKTASAKFLFKKEIHDYLLELEGIFVDYATASGNVNDGRIAADDQSFREHLNRKHEIHRWMAKQLVGGALVKKFEPYLAFYHTSEKTLSIEDNVR